MKNVTKLMYLIMTLSLAFTACQEDVEIMDRGDKTISIRPGGPGDKAPNPDGEERSYPDIIERYYPVDLANYQGTQAWRIQWDVNAEAADPDQVPTFFSTSTGNLNSLQYINGIHPSVKKKLSFSLFTDYRLKSAVEEGALWGGGPATAEAVYFGKIDKTLDQIKAWVTNRPSNFESYWEHVDSVEPEIDYQEGDFFIYQIPGLTPIQYGGIRIVSESPRIIEVYLAVPN